MRILALAGCLVVLSAVVPGSGPQTADAQIPPYTRVTARDHLKRFEYLGMGDYLVSTNRSFFARVQTDGNFCIYKGSGPGDNLGALWCSQAVAPGKQFFALHHANGSFCVFPGTAPNINAGLAPALWCSTKVAPAPSYVVMQNDGNFVMYTGTPGGRSQFVWHVGKTWAVNWLPDGKKLVHLPDRTWFPNDPHAAIYYAVRYPLTNRPYFRFAEKDADAQRFVFMPDTTVRWAHDSSMCLQLDPQIVGEDHSGFYSMMAMGQCNGSAGQKGWAYSASTHQITKSSHPSGCLRVGRPDTREWRGLYTVVYWWVGCSATWRLE